MPNPRSNPYPGPRSFQRGEKLYGRERETAELLDLLIAERIVLLSSPSGAGKTSLVQAALIPVLEAEGFRVLPAMRPGLLPETWRDRQLRTTATSSACCCRWSGSCPRPSRPRWPSWPGLTLADYLDRLPAHRRGDGRHGDVLIFDQFEEVLTLDPTDRDAKLAFFEQVGQALRDRSRWALFSIREEFVAALDPYLRPIPARFDKGRRYRLDLLGPDAAREAMQGPAADQARRRLHRCRRAASWWTICGGCRCSSPTGRWPRRWASTSSRCSSRWSAAGCGTAWRRTT